MIRWSESVEIYLHRDPVDFRKSINGLSVIVDEAMGLMSCSGALFVFCNKKRDKLKALYWDKTGFALWYKRLERDKFNWPRKDINGNRGSGLALPHRLIIVRQNDETTKHLGSRW